MVPELQYLEKLISYRLEHYFSTPNEDTAEPVIPNLKEWHLPIAHFVFQNKLNIYEATILLIALAPCIQPDLFDKAIESRLNDSNNLPRIGGVRGKNSRSFLPTGETALFLLAGEDINARLAAQQLFNAE